MFDVDDLWEKLEVYYVVGWVVGLVVLVVVVIWLLFWVYSLFI